MSNLNQYREIAWLQGLRGIACALVVLTHARYFLADTPAWPFANQILLPGAAGVDLFFVISGFIITYTSCRPGVTPSGFLQQRFTRIWPPYAVMTIVAVLLSASGVVGEHASQDSSPYLRS